jgi:hypothetical protein
MALVPLGLVGLYGAGRPGRSSLKTKVYPPPSLMNLTLVTQTLFLQW